MMTLLATNADESWGRMLKKLTIKIASSVGGGPMQRLAHRLTSPSVDAQVVEGMSPERWRGLLSRGRWGRTRARLESFFRFPLNAVLDASLSDSEVVIPTTNPFFLPWVLVATRHIHGRTVIPLIYDLYPDAIEAAGLTRPDHPASRVAARLNRWMFAHADGIVFIGRRMAEQAMARYGAPKRFTTLATGAEVAEFSPESLGGRAAESDLERWCDTHTVAAYVGAMGHMHDWATLDAAVRAFFENPAPSQKRGGKPLGVVIAASGPGVDHLRQSWRELTTDQVRFVDPLSDRAWARLLARAPIALATLKPRAHQTSMPSKAQSAIAAGAAVVAIAPEDSDLGELVDAHGVGVRVDPGDDAALVDALRRYVDEPKRLQAHRRRAKTVAREHFDMPRLAGKWRHFIDTVRAERSRFRRPPLLKRAVDVTGAATGLLLTAPIMLAAGAAIYGTMGAPVFFRQERPGLQGRTFSLMKFRTMRAARPGEEGPEGDGARLTRVGRLLRQTSIDELPTLLNVLRGDMSLVGPRPLLVRYLERYDAEQARRHHVLPGITGWAQVNGRNAISWSQKFRYDVWYVDNATWWRDIHIVWRTVGKVFAREGISSQGHVTMPEFMGTTSKDSVIDMTRFSKETG